MSQATPPGHTEREASISEELNSDMGDIEVDDVPSEGVIEAYTDLPPEEQRGRPVLSYQIPEEIGELVLTSLSLTPLYRYSRETESTAAWKVGTTSKALIRYNAPSREASPVFMLPPLGEAQLDLRWMLLQSLYRGTPFTIDHLSKDTTRSILKTTRPEHRAGLEELLSEATDS